MRKGGGGERERERKSPVLGLNTVSAGGERKNK